MSVMTQGRLLREAVRELLREAELGTFEPDTGRLAHKNPAATVAASHTDVLQMLDTQDMEDSLQSISAINDLFGFVTNFIQGNLRYTGFVFDTTALLTSVVQFSLAKKRYEDVLAQQERLDPAQRATVLEAYESAYHISIFFMGMSILGYVGALMDMVEIRAGTVIEGAFKMIKWGGYGLSTIDFLDKTDDAYQVSADYLRDVYSTMPEDISQVSQMMNDIIEREGNAIARLAESAGHTDVARAVRLYTESIPEQRRWDPKNP